VFERGSGGEVFERGQRVRCLRAVRRSATNLFTGNPKIYSNFTLSILKQKL
jgi:hypothetical protein